MGLRFCNLTADDADRLPETSFRFTKARFKIKGVGGGQSQECLLTRPSPFPLLTVHQPNALVVNKREYDSYYISILYMLYFS